MKLVRRLTFYLLAAVTCVFAFDTWSSVRSHLALFDEDMRRDQAILGRAVGSAVEQAWRLGGADEAELVLAAMNAAMPGVEARLVPARGAGAPAETSSLRTRGEREPRLATITALHVPAAHPLALEISESLAHERSYSLARVQRAIGTTLAAVIACGLVAWMVGVRVVGRPVEALVAKARRIGRGDFGEPLTLRPQTELADLGREMNEMAASLDAASREIREQSAARLAAQEQLRHADRLTTVGKLASGLAHELGTPLNVVHGRAKMIASGEATSAAEIADSARVIAAQAERMTALVRELLGFARRRSGERQPTDLVALVRHTLALMAPLGAKRGVEVRGVLPSGPLVVRAEASQLQQALMNLVMNGIQASAAQGSVIVTLSATAAAARPGEPPAQRAVLEVADAGAGIAPELMEQVFDPFFTTKPPGEGTGLGLSVAYGIAEDHGGHIAAESELGRGSRFRIELPLEAA